jgi:hypothetical protein
MATWGLRRGLDGRAYVRLGGEWVRYVSRREFLSSMWLYEPGEHVSVLGPTQISGKTRLLTDLLDATDTAFCVIPPLMLVGKPKDTTVDAAAARLGYSVTDQWPPRRRWLKRERPDGWVFWPRHDLDDPRANKERLAAQFKLALNETFKAGNTLTIADELYYLAVSCGLSEEIDRHLTQGMGMGSGLWFATQKPSGTQRGGLSGYVFNSPVHTFIARDPVVKNRRTYADIGGIPTDIVEHATAAMPPFTFLYIHRDGPKICVVGPR